MYFYNLCAINLINDVVIYASKNAEAHNKSDTITAIIMYEIIKLFLSPTSQQAFLTLIDEKNKNAGIDITIVGKYAILIKSPLRPKLRSTDADVKPIIKPFLATQNATAGVQNLKKPHTKINNANNKFSINAFF